MQQQPHEPRVIRQQTAHGWWEMITRAPHPRLRPYVSREYCGWAELSAVPTRRRELPGSRIPLMLNLGERYRILRPGEAPEAGEVLDSFVAGLWDTYVVTASPCTTLGVQVDLTPIAAHLLLRVPMDAIANRVVSLEDVAGPGASRLIDQLREAPGWEARFALIDAALLALVERAREPSLGVAWAWRRLEETNGLVAIGALAKDLGWSRKRLVARFREQVGLTPKTMARILRFDRVVRHLREGGSGRAARWTNVALAAGYYDQSHLIRDFAEFAGTTPAGFAVRIVNSMESVED